MNDAEKQKWLREDAWSERDTGWLLCGESPLASSASTAEFNEAIEALRRAVLVGGLQAICPIDATAGDRMYGHARFFKPAAVIEWAAGRFGKFPFAVEEVRSRGWPWGDYETGLLRELAEAVNRFWVKNYDPTDATTAPTNQQVIGWLRTRDVPQRTAEIMATIIRTDGLPPGPRK